MAETDGANIVLCMIVKNEADVIERCLDSVRDHVDAYIIHDTGSTDLTKDVIDQWASDNSPGYATGSYVKHVDWQDFGTNRTKLLEDAYRYAQKWCDRGDWYALLLDADETLEVHDEGTALNYIGPGDSYNIVETDGGNHWRNKRLVSLQRPWKYVGRCHEYIQIADNSPDASIDVSEQVFTIRHHADGAGGQSGIGRFQRNISLLRQDLEDEPENPRTLFYLANTERDLALCHDPEKGKKVIKELRKAALRHYIKRTEVLGWPEEAYLSFVEAAKLATSEDTRRVTWLAKAIDIRPDRAEAVYWLASHFRTAGCYQVARSILAAYNPDMWKRVWRNIPLPEGLFVEPWAYEWGIYFEASICAYWTGDYGTCLYLCEQLEEHGQLPEAYNAQLLLNAQYARKAIKALEEAKASTEKTTGAPKAP